MPVLARPRPNQFRLAAQAHDAVKGVVAGLRPAGLHQEGLRQLLGVTAHELGVEVGPDAAADILEHVASLLRKGGQP